MTFQPTPEQRRAIEHTSGDLFVSAGAGSGKTAVLARRFVHAVVAGAQVDQVLAITFTRKAAGEVSERVRRVLRAEVGDTEAALRVTRAWISTIHGFCSRILRRHALEAGVAPGFRVLDPTEATLMQEAAFETTAARMWPEDEMRALVERFGAAETRRVVFRLHGRLRSLGATPHDLPDLRVEPLVPKLVEACAAIERALDEHPAEPKNATQAANVPSLRSALTALRAAAKAPSGMQALAATEAVCGCTLKLSCPSTKEHVRTVRDALADILSTIGDAESARHGVVLKRLLESFAERYREAKDRSGVLDQDDLQEAVERLFRLRPEVAEAYAKQFAMIMVDEFQDTNELQVGVIEPLRRDDLCVVGDERQAIYSFRDADVEVFRRMRSGIIEHVSLDTNFRSDPAVLRFVNAVFSAEALFGQDYAPLLPSPHAAEPAEDEMPRAEVLLVEREGWPERQWREAEARALASRLSGLVEEGIAEPGDIVVLLRAFTNSAPYITALEEAGLPAVAAGGGAFSSQPEIMELESLLAVSALAHDEEALATLLLGGLADLDGSTLLRLHALSKERGSLVAAVEAAGGDSSLPDAEVERLLAIQQAVGVIRSESHHSGLADALPRACALLGVHERLLAQGRRGERSWANVRKLVRMAEAFSSDETSDPGAFVEHLRALRRLGGVGQAAPATEGAVRLMTVHSAKGLEFPVVAVADLGRALHDPNDIVLLQPTPRGIEWSLRLPESTLGDPAHKSRPWLRMHESETLRQHAEEKRLLYVACTRAERHLILSGVCKLEESEEGTPLAWVREALGMSGHVGEAGVRSTGGARWLLELVRPDEASDGPARQSQETQSALCGFGPVERGSEVSVDCVGVARKAERREQADSLPGALSFTALKVFESCPYRFYAERVLGLRLAARGDNAALDFGNALHAALEIMKADDFAAEDPTPLACTRLSAIARVHALPEGDLERLTDAVRAFIRSDVAARARAGQRVAREVPFTIPLAGTRLAGSMDLVSWRDDMALVIDYKTGVSAPGRSLSERYRLQAECYALALLGTGLDRVEVAFVAVERGGDTSTISFSSEDAPALREKLETMARATAAGSYERRESYDAASCDGCAALGGLCPVTPPPGRSRGAA